MNPRHWNVLHHGPEPDVVLTVDCGLGRSTAGFADLLANLDRRLTVPEHRRLAEDAFGRLGLPAELAGEITDRFRDFTRYLAVADLLQHRAWNCLPVLVRTVDQDYPLPAGSRAIRLDHTARGPLGDPVVAGLVPAALRPLGADR